MRRGAVWIVEMATGKVYCGETEQSYSGRWHDHVCAVGRYQRNHNVGTAQMYKRLARRGMQGYVFLPWREVSMGGKETRRRLEKMIIYQFPGTLNVKFYCIGTNMGLVTQGKVGY